MYNGLYRRRTIPQVRPVIDEILRTCIYPPVIYLRIERVIRIAKEIGGDSENGRRPGHAIKLLLTDDQLVMQALLHRSLCTLPRLADLNPGDILEILQFVVKKAQRVDGSGHVVYLGIESCYAIKINEKIHGEGPSNINMEAGLRKTKGRTTSEDDDCEDDDFEDLTNKTGVNRLYTRIEKLDNALLQRPAERAATDLAQHRTPLKRKTYPNDSQSDDEQAFETRVVDITRAKRRRQALHELAQNVMSSPSRPITSDSITTISRLHKSVHFEDTPSRNSEKFDMTERKTQYNESAKATRSLSYDGEDGPRSILSKPLQHVDEVVSTTSRYATSAPQVLNHPMPRTWNFSRPTTQIGSVAYAHSQGVLHTLSSLYSPSLPSKSYVFTALVIPTYVASHLISQTNGLFPPKKHIKVIDQSLATRSDISKASVLGKGITVSVYRDAVNFKPIIGKVALMRGVVMQRLRGNLKGSSAKGYGEVILNVYPENSRIHKQSQSQFGSPQQGHGQNQARSTTPDDQQEQKNSDIHGIASHDPALSNSTTSKMSQSETQVKPDATSRSTELPTDVMDNGHWFVDDHQTLRSQGYDVDSLQSWWNRLMEME